MPSALTYPGVYVEEIPSGVHTITGVATSITAFVGRTAQGPSDVPDAPVIINSFADYTRTFGPLDQKYPLGFAVRDFFLNGGATAVIARAAKNATYSQWTNDKLQLQAASPGTWSQNLRTRVTVPDAATAAAIAAQLGVTAADVFNVTIHDAVTGSEETFNNLTAIPSARQITGILQTQSLLVRTKPGWVAATPAKNADPAAGKTNWNDDNASSPANPVGKDSDPLTASADFGDAGAGTGLYLLDHTDLFNLLCIPPDTLGGDLPTDSLRADVTKYCVARRALFILDPPTKWAKVSDITATNLAGDVGISGTDARNAAVYFPRVWEANPLQGGQLAVFPPCGIIAGVMAQTDTTRGIWKAPAGVDAALVGATGLTVTMNDADNGQINPLGVNALRTFPIYGNIVWGARTLRGADALADDYKYVPVRRVALFIEESLYRGLKWVVFEPNDEPLWAQIRLNVGAFMHDLFRQGAFQGGSPKDAYFVACDSTTTTQNDINLGVVNVIVGFAPLKPAEFVVLQIQQMAGLIQT